MSCVLVVRKEFNMNKLPKNLVELFIKGEFSYKKTTTDEYRINSIYVNDKKYHLYISPEKGVFTDFKSGETGSFLKLVKDYLDLSSFKDALEYLIKNYADASFKQNFFDSNKEQEKHSDAINKFIKEDKPVFFKDCNNLGIYGKIAYKYILNRKIDPSYIPKMGYVFNENSKFNKRIVIPFFENNTLVYFITRAIDKNNPIRYLNVEELDSKDYVFNIDNINEELIICEGTFDAMSITRDQAATCLLSADIGIHQMNKIFSKKPKTIIYVPDQDETGHLKMNNNIKKIITYCPYDINVLVYNVPTGCKDLNDMVVKTGKNYILKKECEKYTPNNVLNNDWLKKLNI